MKESDKNSKNIYQSLILKGIKKANLKKYNDSEKYFKKAILINEKKIEAYINLSNLYILQKKKQNCRDILLNYLLKNKFNEEIAIHAAKVFYNYNLINEFKELFKIINPHLKIFSKNRKQLYFIQGQQFEREENYKKAENSYLNSILSDEHSFESYIKLLNLYEKTNQLSKFKLFLKRAIKKFNNLNHKTILVYYQSLLLNREKNYKESYDLILREKCHSKIKNNVNHLIKLFDLQSKNCERLKKYLDAYKFVEQRNKLLINLKENKKFSSIKISDTIKKYKKFYFKKNIQSLNTKLSQEKDHNIVFLVGFPRSGTTLLDTILRTHSQVSVLEEKPFLLNIRHNFFKSKKNDLESIKFITQQEKDNIRKEYFNNIALSKFTNKNLIIDKFPLSIIELGFIKTIFPNSKIILAMRHPCDVITSCLFSAFKINDAMVNFLKLNDTIKFYNEVFDLFEFYEKELHLKYFMIKYENVISNFQNQISSLLKFLDIDYEKNLEKFYVTAKRRERISTPSYNQVINPLYSSSIDRWKNYSKINDSKILLSKWIKKFNYE